MYAPGALGRLYIAQYQLQTPQHVPVMTSCGIIPNFQIIVLNKGSYYASSDPIDWIYKHMLLLSSNFCSSSNVQM